VSPAQELAPLASEARIGVHAQAEQRGSSRVPRNLMMIYDQLLVFDSTVA
jgi:hypothetical protein